MLVTIVFVVVARGVIVVGELVCESTKRERFNRKQEVRK